MKITNNNYNLNFGQLVPTEPLLRIALDKHVYDDTRLLCLSVSKQFPGAKSYYIRGIELKNIIMRKNKNIATIVKELRPYKDNEKNFRLKLRQTISNIGNSVDVNI